MGGARRVARPIAALATREWRTRRRVGARAFPIRTTKGVHRSGRRPTAQAMAQGELVRARTNRNAIRNTGPTIHVISGDAEGAMVGTYAESTTASIRAITGAA